MKTYIKLIEKLTTSDSFFDPKESTSIAEQIVEKWDGSFMDLFIISKLLGDVSGEVSVAIREKAYLETQILGEEEKFSYKGVSITPVNGYRKYEYPDDDYINKVTEELKPVEKKVKSLKASIKAREKELVEANKATLISELKTIKVSK